MTWQFPLYLPTSDDALSQILLRYHLTKGNLIESLLSHDYDRDGKPVALKYVHNFVQFHLEPILLYLTSQTVEEIPENCALFYDLFMRNVPKTFWNTQKRKFLMYELEGPSNDFEANSLLRCIGHETLGGRLKREHCFEHQKEGLCVMFPENVKGGRLRDYMNALIGRTNAITPPFMDWFFKLFVKGVNCYRLIPTRILKQFVSEHELPDRKSLIQSFPLPPVLETVVSKLRGTGLYDNGRKLMFEPSDLLSDSIEIEPETRRILYLSHAQERCVGSIMENMLRFLVGPHTLRKHVLFDALTFYREVIVPNELDESLFGKGTLALLDKLDQNADENVLVAIDHGPKPVKCPKCNYAFGSKAFILNLTNVNTLPRAATSARTSNEYEPTARKLLRSDTEIILGCPDGNDKQGTRFDMIGTEQDIVHQSRAGFVDPVNIQVLE